MSSWYDFLTTGREKVQSALGSPIGRAISVGPLPSSGVSALIPQAASNIVGGASSSSSDVNQGSTALGPGAIAWLTQTPEGQQFAQANNIKLDANGRVISGGAGGTNTIIPSSAVSGANANDPFQGWNPLAGSMFTAQTLAPLLQNIGNQFQGWDKQLLQQAQNAPGQQFLTPSQQAMAQNLQSGMAQSANDVSQSLLGAAVTAPVITNLQNQMATETQKMMQMYAEYLRQNTSSDLTSALAGLGVSAPTGG